MAGIRAVSTADEVATGEVGCHLYIMLYLDSADIHNLLRRPARDSATTTASEVGALLNFVARAPVSAGF